MVLFIFQIYNSEKMAHLILARNKCYQDRSGGSGSVKLAKENVLPGWEPHLTFMDRNGLWGSDNSGFQMRIFVTILQIVFLDTFGDQFLKQVNNIGLNWIIPIFLNHDSGRCTLCINVNETALNTQLINQFCNLMGDVVQAFSWCGFDVNKFLHKKMKINLYGIATLSCFHCHYIALKETDSHKPCR